MGLTTNMKAAERLYGRPIKELILDFYLQYRSKQKVASLFGISRIALGEWCDRVGITEVDLRLAVLEADGVGETVRSAPQPVA